MSIYFRVEIGSGIVSAALQCGDVRCPTEDFTTPVIVTVQHSEEVEVG